MDFKPCPKCQAWWNQQQADYSYYPFDYWLASEVLIHFEGATASFANPDQEQTQVALDILEVAKGASLLIDEIYETKGRVMFFELDILEAIGGHGEYMNNVYALLYTSMYEAQHDSNSDGWPEGIKHKQERRVRPGYIYAVKSNRSGLIKIGLSQTPTTRISALSRIAGEPLQIIALVHTLGMPIIEKELHSLFAPKRVYGEWFRLDASDIEYIKSLQGGA